jgi:hypothetical protein|tara:strand:- start:178 stop:309 length:132 start_codon:yes stop_codon:yes gene_type:complete
MSNIVLVDIIFEVDGKTYTTKKDYDHSALWELITMDDLVELIE